MSSYKKLLNNTFTYFLGSFGSKFIALIMLPFYTSILTQSDFGKIDIIITTLSLIVPILTANIVEAVVRFSLDTKNYSYYSVLSNAIMFIFIAIILFLMALPIFLKFNVLSENIILFFILFVFQSLSITVKQFARSINMTRVYMLSDFNYSITFVIFNIIFLFIIKLGVFGYLLAMALATLFDLIYLLRKTKFYRYINVSKLNVNVFKEMFVYCLPLIPNSLMWWVMSISDRYILTYYLGLSATGLYAVANKFPAIVSNFSSVFFKAWQISAVEEHQKNINTRFHSNVFNMYFFIVIFIGSIFITFSKLIINILVAKEFFDAWKYVSILIIGVIFSSFSSFIGTNYTTVKKNQGAFITALIGACLNLVLNVILIPIIGIYGACISTAISFFIVWLIRVFHTKKYIKMYYPVLNMVVAILLIVIQIIVQLIVISPLDYIINIIIILLMVINSYKFLLPILRKLRLSLFSK